MRKIIVDLEIEDNEKYVYKVSVMEDIEKTKHIVILKKSYYEDLKSKKDPKYLIEKSFEFLLKREPKELIMKKFELSIISKYFPEYSRFIRDL